MKHIAGIACFFLALAVGVGLLNALFMRPDSRNKYAPFYAEKGDIDVFFMGTSCVMSAVYPPLLYRDYGITSYNFGSPAETPEATEWTLRLAMAQKKPKAVVLDVSYIDRAQAEVSTRHFGHVFLDTAPLSLDKLRAIRALYPKEERLQYLLPLTSYHSRWLDILNGEDAPITDSVPCMRGADMRVGRETPAPYARTQAIDDSDCAGKQAVRRIIRLCQQEGIDVVLVAIPYPAEESKQMAMNSAALIAEECGVPFLNLFDEDGLIDLETDCYDPASHLNPDGAVKITARIAKYLGERLSLPDHRMDSDSAAWAEAVAEYERLWAEQWAPLSLLDEAM